MRLPGLSQYLYIAIQGGLTAQFFDRPLILIEKDMYMACSFKLTKGERSKLQQAVINLKLSGKVQQIIDSYFGVPIQ